MASSQADSLPKVRDYLPAVVDEDTFATDEIEKMLAIIGEDPRELLIKSDRNGVEGRRMLQAMMDAEALPRTEALFQDAAELTPV